MCSDKGTAKSVVAANNGNFSWGGAFAKNLFSWKNFTNEFKQGGCVNVAVNATASALNPFSPSLGGFYKRGCQVKTRYPSQGGFVFLGIQPLPASPT
jgi:hypothetical protein